MFTRWKVLLKVIKRLYYHVERKSYLKLTLYVPLSLNHGRILCPVTVIFVFGISSLLLRQGLSTSLSLQSLGLDNDPGLLSGQRFRPLPILKVITQRIFTTISRNKRGRVSILLSKIIKWYFTQ